MDEAGCNLDRQAYRGMGLYVHIPFCIARCHYCDFVSTAGLGRKWQERYSRAVWKEWALYRENASLSHMSAGWGTVYFGGGTPTYLDEDILEKLISMGMSGSRRRQPEGKESADECTVEANPGTLTESKLYMLRQAGCNRLSIGAQSFDDRYLAWLGRKHTVEGFRQAWAQARAAGFTNMNLDLLYGLPEMSVAHWREALREALACKPEHISLYQLNIEEGTPFAELAAAGDVCTADEDVCRELYWEAHQILTGAGFRHYEISNYAKPGYESRHNTLYWRNGYYLGLGAGAAGHLSGVRYTNKADIEAYCSDVEKNVLPIDEKEEIDADLALKEELMLAFRLEEGVGKKLFLERWGFSLDEKYNRAVERLVAAGMLGEDGERWFPTLEGWLHYNSWVQEFL